MNYSEIISGAQKSGQDLQILYLDDCDTDIASFQRRVREFNARDDNNYRSTTKVRIATTKSHEDVWGKLVLNKNEEGFNVLVCDQNMPGKQGLEFIKLLIKEDVDVFYVLYSAGVNVDSSVREECARNHILFFDKIEDLSTLLEKLFKEIIKELPLLATTVRNTFSMEKFYYALANDIIEDMKKVSGTDYRIRSGSKMYSPEDIIHELTNKTEFAIEYVMNYLEGLKFFKKK